MTQQSSGGGGHSLTRPELTSDLQQRALAALEGHPHCLAAKSQKFCETTVMLERVSFIDRIRWDEKTKEQIKRHLTDTETVLIVAFMTAHEVPEFLHGAGSTYDFVLHPETLAILHFTNGVWRS